jgi:hypothetical protein
MRALNILFTRCKALDECLLTAHVYPKDLTTTSRVVGKDNIDLGYSVDSEQSAYQKQGEVLPA